MSSSKKIQSFVLALVAVLTLTASAKIVLAQSAPAWSTSHGYEPRIVATFNGNIQHWNGTQSNQYYQGEPITVKGSITNIQCWVDNVGVGGGDYCIKIYPAFAQKADRAQISAQLDVVGFVQPQTLSPQCGLVGRYFATSYSTVVTQTCWKPTGGGWDGHKLNAADPGSVNGSITLIAPGKIGNHYMRFSYNTPQDDIDGIGHNGQSILNIVNETHDVLFKVIPAPTPTGLKVTPGACDSTNLTLTWYKLPGPSVFNNNPSTGISYNVYHFDGTNPTLVAQIQQPAGGNKVTYIENGLTPGNLYAYKVSTIAYGIETPLSEFQAAIVASPCDEKNKTNIVTPVLQGRASGVGAYQPGPAIQNIQTANNNANVDLTFKVTTTTNSPVNCKLQNVTSGAVDIFSDRNKDAVVPAISGSGSISAGSKAGDGSITSIQVPLGQNTFAYTCRDNAADATDKTSTLTFNVTKSGGNGGGGGGGGNPGGTLGVNMWLNNDPAKKLEAENIRLGQNALVNSEPVDSTNSYTLCQGLIKHPDNTTAFVAIPGGAASNPNGAPITIPAATLQHGLNYYSMACQATDTATGDVIPNLSALTKTSGTTMMIRVFDPRVEEF